MIGGIAMTAIKEKLIGAISIMSDSDAMILWETVQNEYVARKKTWDDIGEVDPTEEEIEILNAYERGDENYQPVMTHEELLKHLDINTN